MFPTPGTLPALLPHLAELSKAKYRMVIKERRLPAFLRGVRWWVQGQGPARWRWQVRVLAAARPRMVAGGGSKPR